MTRRALIALAAMLGIFLTAIDQTAVGTAMPSITRALGGLALYSWVYAGYLLALVVGFALLAGLTAQASLGRVVTPMVVLGISMGLTATMFMIAMQNAVPRTLRGVATSVNVFSRSIGSAIGISLQGAGLGLLTVPDLRTALDSSVQSHLTPAGHEAFRLALAEALHSIFLLGLVLVALGLVTVLLYMPTGSVVELASARAVGGAEAD